jgi:hypothetical protein
VLFEIVDECRPERIGRVTAAELGDCGGHQWNRRAHRPVNRQQELWVGGGEGFVVPEPGRACLQHRHRESDLAPKQVTMAGEHDVFVVTEERRP